MRIETRPLGPLPTNAYLVTCEETSQSMIVDPGWADSSLEEDINLLDVALIVNTHAHWDHIGGNALAKRLTGAPLLIHPDAVPMLEEGGYASSMGLTLEPSPPPDGMLEVGSILEVGKLRFKVLFTPGHAPGHITLFEQLHGVAFVGDVLFKGSVGRVDIPGGDWDTLLHSITTQLLTLPDEVVVYPGHGPQTTIGIERQVNPFL